MLFVIIGRDTPDSKEKRPGVRPEHLNHWQEWDAEGKVVIAGPLTDFAGSLFIVDVESEEVARAKIEADPYLLKGVFESYEIHPFKGVLPSAVYG